MHGDASLVAILLRMGKMSVSMWAERKKIRVCVYACHIYYIYKVCVCVCVCVSVCACGCV